LGQVAPTETRITWRAPGECPDQLQVIRQVEQLLGQQLNLARQQTLLIDGQLRTLSSRRYEVVLTFTTAGSDRRTRRLQHDNCIQLTEGAALVMALAIDPARVRMTEPAASQPGAPNDAPSASHAAERSPAGPRLFALPTTKQAETLGHTSPLEFYGALGVLVQSGLLPTTEPGLEVELSVVTQAALRFGLTGTYGFMSRIRPDATLDAQAEFTQWGLGVRGCWQNGQQWMFAACTDAEFGRITGKGRNVTDPQTRTDNYSALLVGLRGGYRLTSWLILDGACAAGLVAARPNYTFTNLGNIYHPAWWLLRGSLGLAAEFP
jgi:hypothetical protein